MTDAVNQAFAISGVGDARVARVMMFTGSVGAAGTMAHAPLQPLVGAGMVADKGEGWIKYADGTCVQWGTGSGIDKVVTFGKAFDEACWHVSVNVTDVPDGMLVVRHAVSIGKTGFTVKGRYITTGGVQPAANSFSWMAWGR